jgi:hypothetical protein
MEAQKTLFLTREQKQASLDAAVFVLPGAAPQSLRTVKSLIWAIETAPDSSRLNEYLAHRIEKCRRTVVTAARTAEGMGILETVANPGRENSYRINWSKIYDLTPLQFKLHGCNPDCTRAEKTAGVQKELHGCSLDCTGAVETQTVVKSGDYANSNERHAVRDAGAGAMNVMNGCMNDSLGTSQNHSSIHTSHSIPPRKRGGGLGPGGWPERITREMLQRLDKIHELYLFALGRGWITPDDRVGFVATAGHIGRTVKEQDNPGGKFTVRVIAREWDAAPPSAVQAAVKCIARLDSDLQAQAATKEESSCRDATH